MVSDKEARDILEVRANLAEKVPAEKWDTLVADIVGDEDYSFYEEAEYDPLFPGDPGYEAALAEQERMDAEFASATKALPFREELKNALVTLLDELQTKAIASVEAKVKDTHATPHVRTAAGVRKFRQALDNGLDTVDAYVAFQHRPSSDAMPKKLRAQVEAELFGGLPVEMVDTEPRQVVIDGANGPD